MSTIDFFIFDANILTILYIFACKFESLCPKNLNIEERLKKEYRVHRFNYLKDKNWIIPWMITPHFK
jgi:hypothetical protein